MLSGSQSTLVARVLLGGYQGVLVERAGFVKLFLIFIFQNGECVHRHEILLLCTCTGKQRLTYKLY